MIEYQSVDTPYGKCLLAVRIHRENGGAAQKIVFLEFEQQEPGGTAFQRMQAKYPKEVFVEAGANRQESVSRFVFEALFDTRKIRWEDLEVEGTEFQLRVLKTLFEVPMGEIISYSQLAERAGCGNAVRAVASVVASNPVSLIIPCHRIVRKEVFSVPPGREIADYGNYRWGREVKRRLIEWEKARSGSGCSK